MARYRLLITLAIVSLAFAAYGDQPVFAPRDPSAARKDFSNVDPSTAIDALNLGTMATEAKTDYVATDTFTAHVADNSDIHGCTAIASASAVADALSAANASDALLLRLDGIRPMTGDLKFSGNYGVVQNTIDGSDNAATWICGGGYPSYSRGANIQLQGNERPTYGGELALFAGNNASTGHIKFYTASGTERVRLTYGGNLLIGTTTDDGANKLQVNGSVAISSFMQLASPTAIPTAAAGRIYFNGTEAKFKKCLNGSTWVDM